MKIKLFSLLLFVSMIVSLVGATITATTVIAVTQLSQDFFIAHVTPYTGRSPGNIVMDTNSTPGHTTIDARGTNVIELDTRPITASNVNFYTGTWTGHLSLNSIYNGKVNLAIGKYESGAYYYNEVTVTCNSSEINFSIPIQEVITITSGRWLLFKISNATGLIDLKIGGANSYFTSPPGSDWYPDGSTPTLYTLSTNATNGTISVSPKQPAGGYPAGTTVTLNALANSDYTFSGWSGSATGTENPIAITMDGNKTITANFIKSTATYTLTVSTSPSSGAGSIALSPASADNKYTENTQVTLIANPATGYSFLNWDGPVANPNSSSTTITMDDNKSVTAHFGLNTYSISIAVDPDGAGTAHTSDLSTTYTYGYVVTIGAYPNDGYNFAGWEGDVDDPSSTSTTITIDNDKSVTAHFEPSHATHFVVSGFPSPHHAGEEGNFTVTAKNDCNITDTNYSGKVTFTSSDPLAILPGDSSLTHGTGTFTAIFGTIGSQTLTATDNANASITGSHDINIINSDIPPETVEFRITGSTTQVAGSENSLTITAYDESGNVATGYNGDKSITFDFAESTDHGIGTYRPYIIDNTGSVQFGHPAELTFVSGVASNAPMVLYKVETVTILASDGSILTQPDGQLSVTVNPDVAASLAVSGLPSSTLAGVARYVNVEALDRFGNRATGYTGTIEFSSSDSSAILQNDYTFTNTGVSPDNGIHTFTGGVIFNTAGTYYVVASDTQTSSISGSQSGITVTIIQPVVTTLPATAVTNNAAVLHGNLTSTGTKSSVEVSFVYSTSTDAQGNLSGTIHPVTVNASPVTSIPPPDGGTAFNASLSSLIPSTTYYYQSKAVGHGAPVNGKVQAFRTATVLNSIAINPTTASIDVGQTQMFTAAGTFSDGTTQNITNLVAWASNTNSVTINAAGIATGVSAGTAHISANLQTPWGTVSSASSAALTVTNPTFTLQVSPGTLVIPKNETRTARVIATYSNGVIADVTDQVEWAFVPEKVFIAGGLITPVAIGNTTAHASLSGVDSAPFNIQVIQASLDNISVSPASGESETVNAGKIVQLVATGHYGVDTADLTGQVMWSSRNPAVAVVNGAGIVRTYHVEEDTPVVISASMAGMRDASVTLHVQPAVFERIVISPENPTVAFVGDNAPTVQFTANVVWTDGTITNETANVDWNSMDDSVATVDEAGLATTVGDGTAGISATLGASMSNTSTLTVLADTTAPAVVLDYPTDGLTVNSNSVAVSGYVDDAHADVTILVNGNSLALGAAPADINEDGYYEFSKTVTGLNEGNNSIVARAADTATPANIGFSKTREVVYNATGPVAIAITSPRDKLQTKNTKVTVNGTSTGTNQVVVRVNGTNRPAVSVTDGAFTDIVYLAEGDNIITVLSYNGTEVNGTSGTITVKLDTTAPVVTVETPVNGAFVNTANITVTGSVDDPGVSSITLYHYAGEFGEVGPVAYIVAVASGRFRYSFPLAQGVNDIAFEARDRLINISTTDPIRVTMDNTRPGITINPDSLSGTRAYTNSASILISGTIDDHSVSAATMVLRGVEQTIQLAPDGSFSQPVSLNSGSNTIEIRAADRAGNTDTSGVYTVILDTLAPDITLGVSEPTDSTIISVTSNEALNGLPAVNVNSTPVIMTRAGINMWVGNFSPIPVGNYTVTAVGTDLAGNVSTRTATFTKTSITALDSSHPQTIIQNDMTQLDIQANDTLDHPLSGDISVTQHMDNPSGLVDHPEGAPGAAAFVEINVPSELRDALNHENIGITITVHYNPDELPDGTDEATLKLYSWDTSLGVWEVVEDSASDLTSHAITGTLHHLSTYGAFGSISRTLTMAQVGTGGIITPAAGAHSYSDGEVVHLTATADPGWTFTGWSGALTGNASPTVITMDGDKSVAATFTQNEYILKAASSPSGGGSVARSPIQTTYHYGDIVQLTANAASGWTFAGWSGDLNSITNPGNIIINGNKAVTATFTQGGVGGGGGGMGKLTPGGFSSKTPLNIDSKGVVPVASNLTTRDGLATLNITGRTKLLSKEGNALSIMTVEKAASPPSSPDDKMLFSAYIFGPDGATFDPALELSITYDPGELPKDIPEKDLYLAYFDGTQWQGLESAVDTQAKIVTAKITHFSTYALIGAVVSPVIPASSPSPTLTPVVSPTPIAAVTPTPQPAAPVQTLTPVPNPEKPTPLVNWMTIVIIVVAIIVIPAVILTILRRRSN